MSKPITKPRLADVVESAVRALPASATPEEVAKRVTSDPAIAPALKPISRVRSETLQGIVAAGIAPTVVILGKWAGVELVEGDVAQVVATLIMLAGLAWAWYGRETTTRPLA
jgi:hypothetical protein